MFKRGKFCLFDNVPGKLNWDQRSYLPLFLSTLAQKGAAIDLAVRAFDMLFLQLSANPSQDIGIDILQLWLLVIIQPSQCLRFENKLGQQLQREAHPFVPEKAVGFVVNPGYLSNRGFFECKCFRPRARNDQEQHADDDRRYEMDAENPPDNRQCCQTRTIVRVLENIGRGHEPDAD